MSFLSDGLAYFFMMLPGFLTAAGLLGLLLWRTSGTWRALATAYPAAGPAEGRGRHLQTLIFLGGNLNVNTYRGVVTLHADATGLRIDLLGGLVPVLAPMLVPYADMTVTRRNWFLIRDCYEVSTARAPGVRVILYDRTGAWIAEQSGGRFTAQLPAPEKAVSAWPG